MSEPYDCMLTLAVPASLAEEICDHLLQHPQWVSGFSVMPAEGFGVGSRPHTTLEQVRGRANRRLLQLLMHACDVEPLLASLRAEYHSDEMAWWTLPVNGFGRFT
jgi:hypothetical protein